ncbi:hypothetical protein BGX33_007700 [Mortierella sp. NVP41]|nr:hypothetical protein BGX33_007700 [Mortierella sp. NVP41]
MLSERKKLLALLTKRQQLEQEYEQTLASSTKLELDSMIPALVSFFKCTDPADLATKFPTTADMKAAADKQRYFASRKINLNPQTGQVYEQLRQNGTDADYLEFVHMTKTVFISIVSSVLKQNPLYKNQSNGQEIIEKQMAVTLWRMGHNGKDAGIGDASKIFGLSEGSIMKCTQRCMEALNGISVDVVSWPSRGEKRTIKSRIKDTAKHSTTTTTTSINSSIDDNDEPIDDAIGILTSMKILLHTRPVMANPDEYLVPVPPRLVHAAAEWFASSGKKHWASIPIAESSLLAGQDWVDQEFNRATTSTLHSSTTAAAASRPRKRQKAASKSNKTKAASKKTNPNSDAGDPTKRKARNTRKHGSGDVEPQQHTFATTTTATSLISTPSTPTSSMSTSTSGTTLSGTDVDQDASAHQPAPSQTNMGTEINVTTDPAEETDGPTNISIFKSSGYLRRDYGYNVLMVCDSTTRIRLVENMTPASWTDQQSLESSSIHQKSDKLFDEGEYLVADGTFTLSDTVLPVAPPIPTTTTRSASTTPGGATGEEEVRIKVEEGIDGMDEDEDVDMEDAEVQARLYASLARIHKRARDCERMLKARFPSLLGLRVQIKDDQAGHDNAKSWIVACVTIHNLVLADDTSFDPEWETQLDEWESTFRAHQERQARYLWKTVHRAPRKSSKRSDSNNPRASEDPAGDTEGVEDSNSVRAGSSVSAVDTPALTPPPPLSIGLDPLPPPPPPLPSLTYGDDLAQEFNYRLIETGPFAQNQPLGDADIAETLHRLSEAIKASTQAKADTAPLHEERQEQIQQQQPPAQAQGDNDDGAASSTSRDNRGTGDHFLAMLLN